MVAESLYGVDDAMLSIPRRLYFQYIPEGKEFPVLCRRLDPDKVGWATSVLNYMIGQSGREEILLDWNEIAEHYGMFYLSYFSYKWGINQFNIDIQQFKFVDIIIFLSFNL